MDTKIAIVEDNSFLLTSIKDKLSFFDGLKCKFTARNGQDLLNKLERDALIDLILMDIEMPNMNGIVATENVKAIYPHVKVIMLTVFDNDENIFNAIKAGADGYLLKDVEPHVLFDGIKQTINGGAAMTPSIALKTLKLLRNPVEFETGTQDECLKLTERETQVLDQLSKGLNYNKIAENLIISCGTVRKHIENIYRKLQVHNKMEAVQKAKRNNLI